MRARDGGNHQQRLQPTMSEKNREKPNFLECRVEVEPFWREIFKMINSTEIFFAGYYNEFEKKISCDFL